MQFYLIKVFKMPKPMHRSHSFRKLKRVTSTGKVVVHYERKKNSLPHCGLCGVELNGIDQDLKGGRSRRTNSRLFGGVLCANCTAKIVTMRSRIEQGDMKLDDIGIKEKAFVLQLVSH